MESRAKKRGVSDTVATQASSSRDESPSPQIMNRFVQEVFAQLELLEMILDYTMMDKDENLCPDNIRNMRLVQKSWKEAVAKMLLENKLPLFRLKLENGKLLDQFVKYWTTGNKAMPTFRIQLEEDFFQSKNYKSLLNCLKKCGAGLVEVEMDVPKNGGSLTGVLLNIDLPLVQKLSINLTGKRLKYVPESELSHPSNVTMLCGSLLSGCQSLKEFSLTSDNWDELHLLPGAGGVGLPSTLTDLNLNFWGAEQIMELLSENQLPNLESLTLGISCGSALSSARVDQILKNVSKSLVRLQLHGENYFGPTRVPTRLRFPEMNKLKTLEIQRVYFELEKKLPSIETTFPELKELLLYDQTPQMLKKWMPGSPCTSVEILALELVDETKPRIPINTLPLSLEAIQKAHRAFPNVCNLSVDFCGTDISGLKYIFQEMRQLTSLQLTVTGGKSIVGSENWDAYLIGAPVEVVRTVGVLATEHWHGLSLEYKDLPSIRLLKDLTTLSLEEWIEVDAPGNEANGNDDGNSENPLISNLAFAYGFLKMPKLNKLTFKGRFRASEEMNNEWREGGRLINYSE